VLRWVLPILVGLVIGGLVVAFVPSLRGSAPSTAPEQSESAAPAATEAPAETAIPSPDATAETSSPTPTESPSAAYLTTAGYGDVKLGKPVPESTSLLIWNQATDDCGYWGPTDGGGAAYTKGDRGGVVTEIELWDSTISTKSGAHIGMSRADLEKLFPKAAHPEDRLYIVKDDLGQVVFDVEDDDRVSFIRVLQASKKAQPTGGHGICD